MRPPPTSDARIVGDESLRPDQTPDLFSPPFCYAFQMLKYLLLFSLVLVSSVYAQTDFKVAGLEFTAPKDWSIAVPSSSMRAGQWSVKKQGVEPGEVAVFYFGKDQGGDADSNLKRWASLVTTAQGQSATNTVDSRTVNGIKISEVVSYGTYASGMPMPGIPPVPKPDYGLAGAVVESAQGNIFIRFTGPAKLVKENLAGFRQFVNSVQVQK